MRRCLALCAAVLVLCFAVVGNAAEAPKDGGHGFAVTPFSAAGGGFTGSGTLLVGVRARLLRHTPVGIELGTITGYPVIVGFNASGLLYLVSVKSFRMHLNLGVAVLASPFTSPEVPRRTELTLGTGVELDLPFRKIPLTATLDYRAFLPDPAKVPLYFGDYGAAIYREAFKGGQIWFGLGWRFSL